MEHMHGANTFPYKQLRRTLPKSKPTVRSGITRIRVLSVSNVHLHAHDRHDKNYHNYDNSSDSSPPYRMTIHTHLWGKGKDDETA